MRRVGGLWPRVANFAALVDAARVAARGKRDAATVARFLERVEPQCLALERELEDGSWRPSPVHRFEIHDPKRRTITAVPFRDQVVHHALIAVLEPEFERRMIARSFACRRDKGLHAALRLSGRHLRARQWFLRLDVRSFFESVRHQVVMGALRRILKDRRVLDLCETILTGPPATPSTRGLPIGSLTSQWFANVLLDRLDHFVEQEIRPGGYVRYMDDFVLFTDSKAVLRDALPRIEGFLADPLGLALKERATILAPTAAGLPFLGWHLFPGTMRVRPGNLRRYRWRLLQRRAEFERGLRTEESYRQGVASVFQVLRAGDTAGLRRRWCEEHRLDL